MTSNSNRDRADSLIDENLKRVFKDTIEEEVPDRFKDLLAQLKSASAGEKDVSDDTK